MDNSEVTAMLKAGQAIQTLFSHEVTEKVNIEGA